jgi:carboxymethylenebutenolidase
VNDLMTEMVEFEGGRSPLPGYVAQRDDALSYPGVVVIQEWWGMNDHIRSIVERFAQEGFVAVAPDLYRGVTTEEPDDARRLAMELEQEAALGDIQGAINYLISLPQVQPKKVGVIGFCLGGVIAALMSFEGDNIGAVTIFYGGLQIGAERAQRVTAPVLGIFGELDDGIPLELVRTNETDLKNAGKIAEFHIYPNMPHAFFNDTRPHLYDKAAADDARRRTVAWFRKHLS